MRVESAISLINALVYKPGYEFEASDHTKRFEGTVLVRINYSAPETGRESAANGYDKLITTYATFPVAVGDLHGPDSAARLYRRVLDAIMQVELHEAREALRVAPTLWAPFHPHQLDGIQLYANTNGSTIPPELMRDYQFGIG